MMMRSYAPPRKPGGKLPASWAMRLIIGAGLGCWLIVIFFWAGVIAGQGG